MKTGDLLKNMTLFLAAALALAGCATSKTPAETHLWPKGAPGFESRANEPEVVTMREEPGIAPFPVTSNIQNPSITPWLPPVGKIPTAAVIVVPGGAHRFLTMGREGNDVGKFLSERGIAAFVLKYRLARETNSVYKIEVHALQDAQRAIRLVRSRAAEWNINPNKVGILGFSAGGEVAELEAMRCDDGITNAADPIDQISCRPDFQALIYPGNSASITVSSNSPPAFLVCASDDRPDISQGLPNVYLKFKAAHVPVELHIYTLGGHGFGIRNRPMAVSSWQFRFDDWMADMGFAPRAASR
jgi:endo-1,4-beta-xylanase